MLATLQRAGSLAIKTAALSSSNHQPSRRCVILLLQHNSSRWSIRHQSSSAAAAATSSHPSQALHAPSFISRKNVVTTSSTSHEATLASSSSFSSAAATAGGSPTKKRQPLPSNMVFRSAGHSTLAALESAHVGTEVATTATRPLVVLFAWMLSKNVHIEKYREFWTKRGYDILTVQTSPFDLLLPKIGGRKVALNVYDFLNSITPRYDQILIHAFSVGGYQLSEFMHRMSEGIAEGDPEAKRLYQSLKALVIDSCVFANDCPPGLSRAITKNPVVQPLIEKSIDNFLKLTKSFTLDRYRVVEAHLFNNEMNIPGLLLFSRDDVVANVQTNFQLAERWKKDNINTHVQCWDKSVHVLHYKEHPDEYEYAVDKFVAEVDTITKAPKRRPVPPLGQ